MPETKLFSNDPPLYSVILCSFTFSSIETFDSSCSVSKPPNLPGEDWQEMEAAKPDIVTGSV